MPKWFGTKFRGCQQCQLWRRELNNAEGQAKYHNRNWGKRRRAKVERLIDRLFEHRNNACTSTEGTSTAVRPVPVAGEEDKQHREGADKAYGEVSCELSMYGACDHAFCKS